MTACVYVLVDAANQELYIGSTNDVARRVGEHRSKSWWTHVVDVEVYPQPSREVALYVERNLIRKLSPEFNRQSVQPVEHAVQSILRPMFREVQS